MILMSQFQKRCQTTTRYTLLHCAQCLNIRGLTAHRLFRDDLVRWQQLIAPFWLHDLMAGVAVTAMPSGEWRLFEVGCEALDLFLQSHIPGAAYLDTNSLEEEPFWNKVPDPDLLRALLDAGIRCDTTVVLYGRHTTATARAAHLLLYAGVKDVRLLDGGLPAWQRADLPLATGAAHVYPPATAFGAEFPGCPQYLIDTLQAKALLSQRDGALVSIRTWEEFTGKTSGYSYIKARGEIPGARWGHAGDDDDMNSMSTFQQPDGTMRPAHEICQFWRDEDIHPHQQVAFYCGTGWRASMAFYYAWLMNWERISVYDGGWFEWSSNSPDDFNAD